MPAANLAVVSISISSRHVVQRSLLLGTAGQPRQESGAVAGTALSGDRAVDGECDRHSDITDRDRQQSLIQCSL